MDKDLKFEDAVMQAMQQEWNDWCGDTGCFPDDFEWKGGNGTLYFKPGKWAANVARHLQAWNNAERPAQALDAIQLKMMKGFLKDFEDFLRENDLMFGMTLMDKTEEFSALYCAKAFIEKHLKPKETIKAALSPIDPIAEASRKSSEYKYNINQYPVLSTWKQTEVGEVELIRYGVTWEAGASQALLTAMPDGYWTPWHKAVEAQTPALDVAALKKEVLRAYAFITEGDYIEDSVEMALFDFCIDHLLKEGYLTKTPENVSKDDLSNEDDLLTTKNE